MKESVEKIVEIQDIVRSFLDKRKAREQKTLDDKDKRIELCETGLSNKIAELGDSWYETVRGREVYGAKVRLEQIKQKYQQEKQDLEYDELKEVEILHRAIIGREVYCTNCHSS